MAFFGRLGANLAIGFVSEPNHVDTVSEDFGPSWGRPGPILGSSWGFEECLEGILGPLGASWGGPGTTLGASWGNLTPEGCPGGFLVQFDLFATRGVILGPISHNFVGCVLRKFGDHFGSRSAQEGVNMLVQVGRKLKLSVRLGDWHRPA